jgi:hypothetical protein
VGAADFKRREMPQPTAVKPFHKVAWVVGGYVVCLLVASAAVAIRIAVMSGTAAQSAGGMYGFGDTILFVAVFGLSALVPTGAALFFLRPIRPFWNVISASGIALAATGILAAILYAAGRGEPNSRLAAWAGPSVLRIVASPLLALAFLVCAVFSPQRTPRLAFLIAALMEMAVCAYAGAAWFVPMFLHGQ